jgi:hypothetical protein
MRRSRRHERERVTWDAVENEKLDIDHGEFANSTHVTLPQHPAASTPLIPLTITMTQQEDVATTLRPLSPEDSPLDNPAKPDANFAR